jgi:hypothetical protein
MNSYLTAELVKIRQAELIADWAACRPRVRLC